MPSGGKRTNAGRKPNPKQVVRKVLAEQILGSIDEQAAWQRLLNSEDERVALESLKYLTNRRDGCPPQAVEHSGKDGDDFRVVVEHIGRPTPHFKDQASA